MFNFTNGYNSASARYAFLVSDDVIYEIIMATRYPEQEQPSFSLTVDILENTVPTWVYTTISKQWDSGKVTLLELVNENV